jgi:four helix bundle protein
MANLTRFEDIEIWQLARELNKQSYPFLRTLLDSKNYELHNQLERALGSIMDNVAEGFERNGNKEFIQFLSISKASAAEVRSQLFRALDRNLIQQEDFDKFNADCLLISDKISRFMNYLRNSDQRGIKFNRSTDKGI